MEELANLKLTDSIETDESDNYPYLKHDQTINLIKNSKVLLL